MKKTLLKLNPIKIWGKGRYYIASIITSIGRLAHPLIDRFEISKIEHFNRIDRNNLQPIFLVGAPRTGSTILYQIVTNNFDLLYIDNLANTFSKNLYFGLWLSKNLKIKGPHNCFKSDFGRTLKGGFRAPNECGGFCENMLETDNVYQLVEKNEKATSLKMKKYLSAIMGRYRKPIIFKNLKSGQILPIIKVAFPEAKIIFIKRNPFFTAQSIFLAKRKAGIPADRFFGTKPRKYKELAYSSEPEQIVKQIYHMEKQIEQDSALFLKSNFITIHYEEVCRDYKALISKFEIFLNKKAVKSRAIKEPLILPEQKKIINNDVARQIEKEISKLYCESKMPD